MPTETEDRVWYSGSTKYSFFHRLPGRHTGCGVPVGEVVDGQTEKGELLTRAQAEAKGLKECSRCFGHAVRRVPIVGDRVNGRA